MIGTDSNTNIDVDLGAENRLALSLEACTEGAHACEIGRRRVDKVGCAVQRTLFGPFLGSLRGSPRVVEGSTRVAGARSEGCGRSNKVHCTLPDTKESPSQPPLRASVTLVKPSTRGTGARSAPRSHIAGPDCSVSGGTFVDAHAALRSARRFATSRFNCPRSGSVSPVSRNLARISSAS